LLVFCRLLKFLLNCYKELSDKLDWHTFGFGQSTDDQSSYSIIDGRSQFSDCQNGQL
jgi:hypothetical protein